MRNTQHISDRGKTAYFAGVAAEEAVACVYSQRGHRLIAKRWRGKTGEIDLVFGSGPARIFVEVKKSRTFATAAVRVSAKQQRRIFSAAEEFLTKEPQGMLTESRFDVALVNARGEIDILENALATG